MKRKRRSTLTIHYRFWKRKKLKKKIEDNREVGEGWEGKKERNRVGGEGKEERSKKINLSIFLYYFFKKIRID